MKRLATCFLTVLSSLFALSGGSAFGEDVTFDDYVAAFLGDSEIYSSTSPAIGEFGMRAMQCDTPEADAVEAEISALVRPATRSLLADYPTSATAQRAYFKLNQGALLLQRCRPNVIRNIAEQAVGRADMPDAVREWGILKLVNLGRISQPEHAEAYASVLVDRANLTFRDDPEMRWFIIQTALGVQQGKPVSDWLPALEYETFAELLKEDLLDYRYPGAGMRMMGVIAFLAWGNEEDDAYPLFKLELRRYLEDAEAGANYINPQEAEMIRNMAQGLNVRAK